MNIYRITIATALFAGLSHAAIHAQSPSASDETRPASYTQAVTTGARGCQSCGEPRYTQYARPHASFLVTDYVNPTPAGPCCRTVFGELICDVGYHLGRLVRGDGDILASTSADYGCEMGCVGPLDCVPRLRDLVPGTWFYNLFGPSWACQTCGPWDDYTVDGSCLDDPMGIGEAFEPMDSVPTPADASERSDNVPDAPSMPVTSARLRAVTTPPGLSRPSLPVTRSQYMQATRRAEPQTFPVRLAGRPTSAQPTPRLEQPEIGTGRRVTTAPLDRSAANASLETHRPQRLVPPSRAIRFGDQFGKSPRPRFAGATFR